MASAPQVVCLAPARARWPLAEPVDSSEYYFRTALIFDCADGPDQWLRERLSVASIAPRAGGVTVDVYEVL